MLSVSSNVRGAPVAQSEGCWTCDWKVADSNPGLKVHVGLFPYFLLYVLSLSLGWDIKLRPWFNHLSVCFWRNTSMYVLTSILSGAGTLSPIITGHRNLLLNSVNQTLPQYKHWITSSIPSPKLPLLISYVWYGSRFMDIFFTIQFNNIYNQAFMQK